VRVRTILIASAIAVVAAAPAARAATPPRPHCPHADTVPSAAAVAQVRAALLCLVNEQRAAHGAAALRAEAHLRTAAQRYASVLGLDGPLVHDAQDTTPQARLVAAGYGEPGAFLYGETIGRSFGTTAAPATRLASWLRDAATRKLLLATRFRDIGIGVRTDGTAATYVLELGALRRTASANSKRPSGSSRRSPKSSRS
jgi:uncharacterized protein YkwD